jgi:hypothetical protein
MKHNPVSEVVRVEAGAAECAAFDHRDRHSRASEASRQGRPGLAGADTMAA